MDIKIIEYDKKYIKEILNIWNDIVEEGIAFPQIETLDEELGDNLFREQTFTGLAIDENSNEVLGLYILHPNNIGRCGHICNASYGVKKDKRGMKIGEKLVIDSITIGKHFNFRILQFNAVVKTNISAIKLYKKLGFIKLGTISKGFLRKDGIYEDIIPHYYELVK